MASFKTDLVLSFLRNMRLSFRAEAAVTGLEPIVNRLINARAANSSTPGPSQAPIPPAPPGRVAPQQPPSPARANAGSSGERRESEQLRQQLEFANTALMRKEQELQKLRQQRGDGRREPEAEKRIRELGGEEAKDRELKAYDQLAEDFGKKTVESGYGDLSRGWWYHTIELGSDLVTPGVYDHRPNLPAFKFPANMEGMNVLDVGSATGFFAFEFEKRGANVTSVELPPGTPADKFPLETAQQTRKRAERIKRSMSSQILDNVEQRPDVSGEDAAELPPRFHNEEAFKFCHEVLGSKVQRRYSSIYELSKEKVGRDDFDLVFLGDVLIHTIAPLQALAAVTPICRGTLIISQDLAGGSYPAMTYIGGDTPGEDKSSWWKPNKLCFEQILKKLGFREVTLVGEHLGFQRPVMAPYRRGVIHAIR